MERKSKKQDIRNICVDMKLETCIGEYKVLTSDEKYPLCTIIYGPSSERDEMDVYYESQNHPTLAIALREHIKVAGNIEKYINNYFKENGWKPIKVILPKR